jgi:hypothetical protein
MLLLSRGGVGGGNATEGEDGSITGIDCPPGLHGIFCEVVCLTYSGACLDILIMTSCVQNCKYGLIGIMFLQTQMDINEGALQFRMVQMTAG